MGHMNILKFNSLIPELSVTDILKTKHFYVNVLGFEICYERKEDNFIFVRYEGNQIMLEQLNDNWCTGPMNYPFGRGINLEMTVSDVDALYKKVIKNKLDMFIEMETKVYKCDREEILQKQFLVQDPDGYLLRFVE